MSAPSNNATADADAPPPHGAGAAAPPLAAGAAANAAIVYWDQNEGRYSFVGEKLRPSDLLAQQLLTALGQRLLRFTKIGSGGLREVKDSYKVYENFSFKLFADIMTFLRHSDKLSVRNGYDITAVIFMVNQDGFRGTIHVPRMEVRTFVASKIKTRLRNKIAFEID